MIDNISNADVARLEQLLADCSRICRSLTVSPDLIIAQEHSLPDISNLIRRVNDCAASCDMAVLLLERKSPIIIDFLQLCEELTMECAWECSKYGFGICKRCSEACELVAKACLPYVIQHDPV